MIGELQQILVYIGGFNVIDFQRGGTVVAISGSGDTTSC